MRLEGKVAAITGAASGFGEGAARRFVAEGAKVVISKVKQALKAEDYVFRGKKLEVFINISAVTRREEDLSLQEMLQEGEVELFRAKQEAAGTTPSAIT